MSFVQPWCPRSSRQVALSRCNVRTATPRGRVTTRCSRVESSILEEKTKDYNLTMSQRMGWEHLNPYEYHPERGLYYHEIARNVICGSQPRNPHDIDILKNDVNVTTVINLQQDKDLQYWGVHLDAIQKRCHEQNIKFIRRPARDFDPHSLRRVLPSAVRSLNEAWVNQERVYVHCTAGLGRAPAVIIAFLFWFRNMQLDHAYKHLTDIRPCGPKRDAIRGATYDLLTGGDFNMFFKLPADAYASLNSSDRETLQQRVRNA